MLADLLLEGTPLLILLPASLWIGFRAGRRERQFDRLAAHLERRLTRGAKGGQS